MIRLLKKIPDALTVMVIDGLLSWFTPKWRRRAYMIYKGGSKFLNYSRDLLSDEQIDDLQQAIASLRSALLRFNKQQIITSSGKLESLVDSMPGATPAGWLAENVEVIFVIMVIFLGISAFIVKPFRIPTGSMQPSLNGIIIHDYDEEPGALTWAAHKIAYGSSYLNEEAQSHARIVKYSQGTKFLLFTYTTVIFDNGTSLDIPCARGEVQRYFIGKKGSPFPEFAPGETIIKGRIDAGDLILVNRMAYHFRKPRLGETFVFDTRDIEGIKLRSGDEQGGGTHYVKRLCGLPGDTVSINEPYLIINGKTAEPWTIKRVMERRPPYNATGYIPAPPEPGNNGMQRRIPRYIGPGQTMRLLNSPDCPALNQYCALGDNTVSSLDSRYWGPVNQYNVVGPAWFALWPFTSHWGIIP